MYAPSDAMSITELAVALGVRPSTLRHWDAEGLVVPRRDSVRQSRHYSPDQVRDARIIHQLRMAGYRIASLNALMPQFATRPPLGNGLEPSATADDVALERLLPRIGYRRLFSSLRDGANYARVAEGPFMTLRRIENEMGRTRGTRRGGAGCRGPG